MSERKLFERHTGKPEEKALLWITVLLGWVVSVAVLYGFLSFILWNFDCAEWHWIVRAVFGIGAGWFGIRAMNKAMSKLSNAAREASLAERERELYEALERATGLLKMHMPNATAAISEGEKALAKARGEVE